MSNKKYPSTYVTSDVVVLKPTKTGDQILLIQRRNEPFKDHWALPGGFFDLEDLNIKECAARELQEETCLLRPSSEFQLIGIYSEKNRDPRENNPDDPCRVVSVAFLLRLYEEAQKIEAQDDAKQLAFFDVSKLPSLAFDHKQIISDALKLTL